MKDRNQCFYRLSRKDTQHTKNDNNILNYRELTLANSIGYSSQKCHEVYHRPDSNPRLQQPPSHLRTISYPPTTISSRATARSKDFSSKKKKKGLSLISNRQRRKEGTFSASELAGIEPTPPAPKGAGYVLLHLQNIHHHHCLYSFPNSGLRSLRLRHPRNLPTLY
jgi:hypothetical protein